MPGAIVAATIEWPVYNQRIRNVAILRVKERSPLRYLVFGQCCRRELTALNTRLEVKSAGASQGVSAIEVMGI